MSALKAKNEIEANAKIGAAKNMLERARDLLEL